MREFSKSQGTTTTFEDLGGDGFALHTTEDVAPVINSNKAMQNAGNHAADENFWHAAKIPSSIILKWLVEDQIDVYNPDDIDRVKAKLNDPDYRHLRTGNFII